MLLNSKRFHEHKEISKGLIFSLESLACLIILLISLNALTIRENPSISREIAYIQSQDIVETCIAKKKPEEGCFKKIEHINPYVEHQKEGEIEIKRRINGEIEKIEFSYSSTSK